MKLHPGIRDEILLQSKCTLIRDDFQTLSNGQSKEHILASSENSLKNLNTDYLDVYMLHAADTLVEPEEVAAAFDIPHSQGKVHYFGVSNHRPLQIELLKKYLNQRLIIDQLQFSVAHTDLIDASMTMRLRLSANIDRTGGDVFTYTRLNDTTIQGWSPFQFGFYGRIPWQQRVSEAESSREPHGGGGRFAHRHRHRVDSALSGEGPASYRHCER